MMTLVMFALVVQEQSEARARQLYGEAVAHYRAAEYAPAIDLFRQAYEASPAPGLLFDLAQAYRLAGDCEHASEYYRRYLDADPTASNRSIVETLLPSTETCAADRARHSPPPVLRIQPVAETTPAAASELDVRPPPRSLAFPLTLIAEGTATVAGAALVWSAHREYDDLEHSCAPRCQPSEWDGPRAREWVGYGLVVGGGVALTATMIFHWRPGASGTRRAGVWVAPTGLGAAVGGGF